jgi:hypothetical protein
MRNVKDGHSGATKCGDAIEQFFNLLSRQGGGRFIEDNNAGLYRKCFGDFNHLAIRHGELTYFHSGMDTQVESSEDGFGLHIDPLPIDSFH